MTIGLLTNIISPHQIPLANAIAERIGANNYRYVHTEEFHAERAKMGWGCDASSLKFRVSTFDTESRTWLENADLVYCEEREFDLLESRLKAGKKTFYVSERWFKPIGTRLELKVGVGEWRFVLPGWIRLFNPSYFRMARRFVKLFDYSDFRYLPQGKWAENDMALLCRVMGRTMSKDQVIPWGYFVAPSKYSRRERVEHGDGVLRVLWVGRMIGWKRVDTIIRAIKSLDANRYSLTLVGSGDKQMKLAMLADGAENIVFKDNLPIEEIRNEMRDNDVYVLSSNGEEGWGAALNEAMEEGMIALGTFEAGSSSYILPDTHKFHAGDWRRLATLLREVADGKLSRVAIGTWSASSAAERMVGLLHDGNNL